MSKRTAGALLGYDPISDRIMVIRLEGKRFKLTLVQVYAPTNRAFEDDKTQFYEQLQDVIDQAPRGDIVLISGNFNAKLGAGSSVGRFLKRRKCLKRLK